MRNNPWLVRRPEGTAKSVRLYCFSYAGGNASQFQSWQAGVDPRIEVCAIQLPGRGARFREPPPDSLSAIIEPVAEAIEAEHDKPFALFGHSFGALLAFELARFCSGIAMGGARHVFVSGCAAPSRITPGQRIHLLPDHEFLEALYRYKGTPADILQNRELMELMLPTIRSDFALNAEYRYHAERPMPVPLSVFAGRQDLDIGEASLLRWRAETSAAFAITWFEGGHFFIDQQRQAVLEAINRTLQPLLR